MIFKTKKYKIILTLAAVLLLSSCTQRMGYGVLLWSIEEPPILSGSVLPVYVRSSIEKAWIVGVPHQLISGDVPDKVEVSLSNFEYIGNKRKAEARAAEFSEFARTYAENLQDGLPVRENTDNGARRVYRLRLGEVIKVLGIVNGIPPISGSGDPLPGNWLKVLTTEGITGYCFSYRLRLYEQDDGSIQSVEFDSSEIINDPDLDMVLSTIWSSESYQQMIDANRVNIQAMEKNYRFDPGQETGIARIVLPDLERQFRYQKISSDGQRTWRFEGTSLQMTLNANNSLTVQFSETSVIRRYLNFVTLPTTIRNIILRETARRESLYKTIFDQGPKFSSTDYGTITLISTGNFTWTGYDSLVPQLFPEETKGVGRINMDLHISDAFQDRYIGAFTLTFSDIRTNNIFYFMYGIDDEGLRLEVVPASGIDDITVVRRATTPVILYFFKDILSQ